MANSHYSADSAPLPPLSLRPGLPGSSKQESVKTACFRALPVDDALPMPANYVLADAASVYVGESADGARRLPDLGTISAEPGLSDSSPTTTSND